MSRRRLPAPPLVLQPVLRRARRGSARAELLLDLARFLSQRGLLTDGGSLSLAAGLEGRGGSVSLTTQDVRASAHGLVLELLDETTGSHWAPLAEAYYARYDRGKPRRPTRLQRLYSEWSADHGPLGLLEACQAQPPLWEALREALSYQAPDDRDRRLLAVALGVRDSGDWQGWLQAYEVDERSRSALLLTLPLLPSPPAAERLPWLAGQAERESPLEELLLACRRPASARAVPMPSSLIDLCLKLVEGAPGEVDARWLGLLRTYSWPGRDLARLRSLVAETDPVRRIVYGPRPGRPWLEELWSDMKKLAF